jgi:glucokinase
MGQNYIVGADLGGTQIRACLADVHGKILKESRQATLAEEGVQAVLGRIKHTLHQVVDCVSGGDVLGIGMGSPGPLDPVAGVVVEAANLPGWKNVPLRDLLMDEFRMPVWVNNDANVAALAEHRFGAGRGYSDLVYLTISTGIGGGFICGGKLLLGVHGYAGEPGHITVEPNGPRCNCGNIGCLETLAAGPAIARRATELLRAGQHSSLAPLLEANRGLTSEMVGRAALQGDAVALKAVQRASYYLGIGVLNLIHLFDPAVVILGGGVSKLGSLLFGPVHELVRERAITAQQRATPIVPAELGDQVGLLGGVALVIMNQEGEAHP